MNYHHRLVFKGTCEDRFTGKNWNKLSRSYSYLKTQFLILKAVVYSQVMYIDCLEAAILYFQCFIQSHWSISRLCHTQGISINWPIKSTDLDQARSYTKEWLFRCMLLVVSFLLLSDHGMVVHLFKMNYS